MKNENNITKMFAEYLKNELYHGSKTLIGKITPH